MSQHHHEQQQQGLPRATYGAILRDVDLPVLCCMHLGLLSARYPGVAADTIAAIFAQENQHKVIKSHHTHKALMPAYVNRYLAGQDVLALCGDVDFPPCLMMRRMLELLLRLPKQRVSDVLKQPALLQSVDTAACLASWQQQQGDQGGGATAATATSSSLDPQHLTQRLQADVVRCIHADRAYSPYCDMAKSLAGLEHEALLYDRLDTAGIVYWSETQLRERGLFKTPDALLQVPVAMRGPDGAWHIVHWLDSKASFGDDRTHRQQLEGQYATYVNRYGPGCVIYWFSFIADLAGSSDASSGSGAGSGSGGGGSVSSADVCLRDSFPGAADILQLPQLAGGSGSSKGLSVPQPTAAATVLGC